MLQKQSLKLGFLITYGTDTMSWGLSAIRYMLKNLPVNVAITGSQVPLSFQFSSSDVYPNVENSIKLLTQLTGPEIFVVFNSGQAAFRDTLWKFDKWSPDAFRGEELARISQDEIIIRGKSYPMNPNRKLDKLYLIRTGGTIDSELSEDNVMIPTGNLIVDFISKRFSGMYTEFIPIPLMAVDSSEMVFDFWKKISIKITEECNKAGYTTFCDVNFNTNVQIISTSPLMREEDYFKAFEAADGIILNAYGSGTININVKSGFSPLPAIEKAISEGKYIIIASHTPFGTQDFIYENAWEPIKKGAIPAGDFSVAHCQIKLAYILGHLKEIEQFAHKFDIPKETLVRIAFLSGVDFRSNASRKKFENLIGYQIPLEDPFFNLPFKIALQKIFRFLNRTEVEELTIHSLKTFEEIYEKYFKNPEMRSKWTVILKPDSVIGANEWGELIDASKNLTTITSQLLNWNIITIELSEIKYDDLVSKISILSNNKETIGDFFRTFKYVIIEGGRQSLYDANSFDRYSNFMFSKENYLHLLRSLMFARNNLGANPSLYLCLGHQGFVEMLRGYLIQLVTNSEYIIELLRKYDEKASANFQAIIQEIASVGKNSVIQSRNQKIVAKSYLDQFFAIKENELPEIGLKQMVKYKPTKGILPEKVLKVYHKIAKYNTGLLEDFFSLEALDIVMLHGDEVNEAAILFFNWALNLISKFVKTYNKILQNESILKEIANLPFGIEILCSTLYKFENESPLTEIAGMVIYYYNSETQIVKRDYSLQFHPELFEEIRMLQKRDFESKTMLELSDGIQLLLSCLQAGFIETSKRY